MVCLKILKSFTNPTKIKEQFVTKPEHLCKCECRGNGHNGTMQPVNKKMDNVTVKGSEREICFFYYGTLYSICKGLYLFIVIIMR